MHIIEKNLKHSIVYPSHFKAKNQFFHIKKNLKSTCYSNTIYCGCLEFTDVFTDVEFFPSLFCLFAIVSLI